MLSKQAKDERGEVARVISKDFGLFKFRHGDRSLTRLADSTIHSIWHNDGHLFPAFPGIEINDIRHRLQVVFAYRTTTKTANCVC
jgi:hypothetical protein